MPRPPKKKCSESICAYGILYISIFYTNISRYHVVAFSFTLSLSLSLTRMHELAHKINGCHIWWPIKQFEHSVVDILLPLAVALFIFVFATAAGPPCLFRCGRCRHHCRRRRRRRRSCCHSHHRRHLRRRQRRHSLPSLLRQCCPS
jgi:hypothetical protein